MFVHNSEHNSPINSDHDDDIHDHDPVTRISKLDISDPLHLHLNDTTALTVVSIKLKGTENYQVWSCAMLLALEGKNKIGFIDGSCKRSNTDEYDAMIELPKCVCNASEGFKKHNQLLKLMQFLMGLDDSYMQIRSFILSRETLPGVRSDYATISSEESHRVAVGSIASSSQRNQASAFVSNVPYSQNFQRNNQNFNTGPSRPNNVNNNRQGGGSSLNNNRPSGGHILVCENYGYNGHTIDRCFKINGYPADFGKKKSGQNVKKQGVSNNNSVGKSSSSGFTDEQMTTLISLIKDNKAGKNVQANMAGENQHMTYTDKELDNVIDISHLKIKVGHPNGTEACISKIGNIRLSNGLTLYDVMVIPEYCVTLISVHKLFKENKVIVAFDENRCYFLNQNLNLKNVLGLVNNVKHDWHCRLGHPADPVLNVLKDSLNFNKRDNTVCCEICQRAKQTREHFPLSDHKSKNLGDLVHLDLWGPFKVTSSEGFKFFLIVVDDYTRAVWDSEVGKNDSTNVLQDVNHINFFDIEYPDIPNDNERVANDLNKGKSDSSSSFESGSNINTADFLVDSGNDVDSSNDFVATHNAEVVTLEENIFSEGNLDQNPSFSQGVQNFRRSSRQSVFPKNYNDFVVESKVKYGIEKYVSYSKLNTENFCFISQLNKTRELKTYFEASNILIVLMIWNSRNQCLLRNGTWEIVELPEGKKPQEGFGQKEGIDYEETFSPVVKMVIVRCLLNIVVSMSWPIFKLDVNNAFLYGDLEEAQWNAKLTSTLIKNGFSQSKSDYSLYTKSDKGVFLSLLVYVDDIFITGNNVSEIEKFKVFLKSKFMIKFLGKLKYFLRIEVIDTDKGICLNQRKSVLDLLSEYGMLACKPAKIPLMSKLVISNEAYDNDPSLENVNDYQKLMGKLIYLTNTRPDISYVVHCLSQFMHSPLTSHLRITFKILRYLKSCPGLGIHIAMISSMFPNVYSDAGWAKCIVTRKLVTGYCVFLNNSLISWKNILTKGLDTIKHSGLVKRLVIDFGESFGPKFNDLSKDRRAVMPFAVSWVLVKALIKVVFVRDGLLSSMITGFFISAIADLLSTFAAMNSDSHDDSATLAWDSLILCSFNLGSTCFYSFISYLKHPIKLRYSVALTIVPSVIFVSLVPGSIGINVSLQSIIPASFKILLAYADCFIEMSPLVCVTSIPR
ncbi:ribonuclease H-like domain-containing protein [Tanacetum coccineum]